MQPFDPSKLLIEQRCVAFEGLMRRAVESQYQNSTRQLVDSDDEQQLLERLIERHKPPLPHDPTCQGMHYLLTTPFRYPPLNYGSRFGQRNERGIWYGAEHLRTVFAEVAFYRLLFLEDSRADLGQITSRHTAFVVSIDSPRSVDLTAAGFIDLHAPLCSKTSYRFTQALGTYLRSLEVQMCLYTSARDPEHGKACAIFSPNAFKNKNPHGTTSEWVCVASHERVEFRRQNHTLKSERYSFARELFLVGSQLPRPSA